MILKGGAVLLHGYRSGRATRGPDDASKAPSCTRHTSPPTRSNNESVLAHRWPSAWATFDLP
jgi:hypothetical protein